MIRSLTAQWRRRADWLAVLARSPGSATLDWQAQVRGRAVLLGEGVVIQHGAILESDGPDPRASIQIGARTSIRSGAQIHCWGGTVTIGRRCSLNAGVILYGSGGIRIGDGVRIAAHTVVVASAHRFDRTDVPIIDQGVTAHGIVIEDDVWIGAGACILDGVHIGRGAVVGAGAVVTTSVEAGAVVGGIPARHLRDRAAGDTAEGALARAMHP